jgi:hypothetical protein
MPDGEHADVDPVQPSRGDRALDGAPAEAALPQLVERHAAVLRRGHGGHHLPALGAFDIHQVS